MQSLSTAASRILQLPRYILPLRGVFSWPGSNTATSGSIPVRWFCVIHSGNVSRSVLLPRLGLEGLTRRMLAVVITLTVYCLGSGLNGCCDKNAFCFLCCNSKVSAPSFSWYYVAPGRSKSILLTLWHCFTFGMSLSACISTWEQTDFLPLKKREKKRERERKQAK